MRKEWLVFHWSVVTILAIDIMANIPMRQWFLVIGFICINICSYNWGHIVCGDKIEKILDEEIDKLKKEAQNSD